MLEFFGRRVGFLVCFNQPGIHFYPCVYMLFFKDKITYIHNIFA